MIILSCFCSFAWIKIIVVRGIYGKQLEKSVFSKIVSFIFSYFF